MINFNKGIEDVGNIVDNVHTSGEEAAAISTERQRIDISSPFMLPHLIRPLITIWAAVMWSMTIIWAMALISRSQETLLNAALNLDSVVMYSLASTSAILSTCVSWYFHSRKIEKKTLIEAKANIAKSEAAIEIRRIEVKESIRKTKVQERSDKRKTKKAERKERRGN